MRHKKENRFQFVNFSDRIAKINVDIIRRYNRTDGTTEDTESFFHAAIEKWSDLDCSNDFADFKRQVGSHQLHTLPQVLLFKAEIADCLKIHLAKPESQCVGTLLELTIALSRDLQQDFHPFVWDFYDIFLSLLEKNELNPEFLDLLFTAVAYLLKYLWKSLVRELKKSFRKFIPLFGHRKHYVRQFASEAFAFLLRKTKKLTKFVEYCVRILEKDPSLTDGVAQLLFHSIRGVRRQFHSTSTLVYEQLLGLMHSGKCVAFAPGTVVTIMEKLTELMTKFADIESAKTMLEVVRGMIAACRIVVDRNDSKFFCSLLTILNVWVGYKEGYFMKDPSAILETLGDKLSLLSDDYGSDAEAALLKTIASLITSKTSTIPSDQLKSVLSVASNGEQPSAALFDFFTSLLPMDSFDAIVRPFYVQFVRKHLMAEEDGEEYEEGDFNWRSLRGLMAMIHVKASVAPRGINYETDFLWKSWKPCQLYPVDKQEFDYLFEFILRQLIKLPFPDNVYSVYESAGSMPDEELAATKTAISFIPHLKDPRVIVEIFEDVFLMLLSVKWDGCLEEDHHSLLYLCLTTAILVLKEELFNLLSFEPLADLLSKNLQSVTVLSSVDVYLGFAHSIQMENVLSVDTFAQLIEMLSPNLMSPLHSIRILTARILSYFPVSLSPSEGQDQIPLFELCTRIESVAVTMETYRERLRLMRKLTFAECKHHLPQPAEKFESLPLRFLIGQLHVNFTVLWPHVIEFIASYAKEMKSESFWEIFAAQLEMASKQEFLDPPSEEERSMRLTMILNYQDDLAAQELVDLWMALQLGWTQFREFSRPDHVSFRVLLWKCIGAFADVAEKRSRQFTHLFLQFIDSEVTTIARKENIATDSVNNVAPVPMEIESAKESKDAEDPVDEKEKHKGVATEKTLLAMLDAFGKFHNPRALVMEPKIYEVYMELLLRSSGKVQAAVMKCVFGYKHKFVTPYQEHLERILNEKTMKDELVLFSLAEEVSIVDAAHRPELLKILLRILYGKIYTRSFGSGSHDLLQRRNMIFRFLAGCSSDELKSFIDLLFEPVRRYMVVDRSLQEMVDCVADSYDLKSSVPLRKLQGLLVMLSLVYKRLGEGLLDMLPYLLRVLLTVSAVVKVVVERKQMVLPRCYGMLKTLRALMVERMVEFLTIFDNYPFTESELTCMFEVIVKPLLSGYSESGCQAPTGLTKLFVCWSQNPRYFCLFNVLGADGRTPILSIMQLLLNRNCQPAVQSTILDIVSSLLSMADFSPSEENGGQLPCAQAPLALVKRAVPNDLNLGTKILLSCVPQLLQYMKGKAFVSDKKSPSNKDLEILVKLCEFVDDPDHCHRLIELLLPYLVNSRIKQEFSQVNALRSIQLLMELAKNSGEFLDQLAPLLESLKSRPARAVLCDILKVVGKRNTDSAQFVDIVVRMNTWDPKRVEEPDYKIRLAAHKELNQLLEFPESSLELKFARLVLNNLAFAIANLDDMSLRDSASNSLLLLMKKIVVELTDVKIRNNFVAKQIVPVLKSGLKMETEVVRHEFITVLKNCLLLFPDCPRFGNLHQLLNNDDPDLDFFDNMRNIQLYRRTRAIRRLCETLKAQSETPNEQRISWESLQSFVVPLIRPFLFNPIYSKNSALLDESAKFVGVVAQLMPWPRYKMMLEYYLTRMQKDFEHQRYVVKVVVAILDGFHFYDLTSGVTETAAAEPMDEDLDPSDQLGDSVATPKLTTTRKIYDSVVTYLIPKLSQCLQRKITTVGAQKINEDGTKVYEEDEEILRIPVAFAMVKLLQKTDEKLLNSHLPSVLLRICTLLKSRSQDIRDSARKTLVAIMKTLGPQYLTYFIKEVKGVLLRGYQVHVRNFCVNLVLSELADQFRPSDLDSCVTDIVQICNEELFGSVGDEKEISELTKNLNEARGNKTIETYEIIGKFCSQEKLRFVLESLKEILNTQQTHKTVKKVGDVCRYLAQGLAQNSGLSIEGCLIFIHHVLLENLSALFDDKGKVESDTANESTLVKKADSFVLVPEPGRAGAAPVHSKKSTMHVLIEFAFQELLSLLKQNKLLATNETHSGLLDPFVPLILKGIHSAFPKVIGLCLRCFASFSKFPLPALKSSYKSFVDRFFVLLNQYGSVGAAAKGDSLELILRLFKAVTCVVREGIHFTITTKQLKVLLQYAEQDIFDLNRQACAFSLIRAILSRKLVCEDISTLLSKVRELAITSPVDHVRLQCRQIFLQYLLDYPIGKGVRKHIEFCLTQLSYELEDGRLSNLLIIESLINNLNQQVLHEFCPLIFLNLGVQLINDTSAKCKKLITQCIRCLLTKIEIPKRDVLFQMTTSWLQSDKAIQKRLSVQLCGILADVEEDKFDRRLSALLPEWTRVIGTPTCLYSFQSTEPEEDESRCDQFLLQLLTSFMTICRKCPSAIRSPEFAEDLSALWGFCQKCLTHPHRLIRLNSSQCFGVLFFNYKAEEIDSSAVVRSKEFLLSNTKDKIGSLCDSFCRQLWFHPLQLDIGEQAVKNLVFLGRVLRLNEWKDEEKEVGDEGAERKLLTLEAVARQMSKLCRVEMIKNPKIIVKRLSVFKWFAAMVLDSSVEVAEQLALVIVPHLHRELTVGDAEAELRALAGEVCEIVKGKLGLDTFSKIYSDCQLRAATKKELRKRTLAAEAVSDPQLFATKKIRRHQSKVESRKRKISALKPYRDRSKRKRSQEELEDQ